MDLERLFKDQLYLNEMRPVFSKRALYTDTTENFVTPAEPAPYSRVKIRFRSKRSNIDRVFLVCKGQKHLMFKVVSDEQFDYYEIRLQLDNEKISYFFEIQAGAITCYYDFRGVVKRPDEHYNFVIIPGFDTPDWAKGAVMYQIYVDRFCNGDPSNDVLTNEYQYIGNKSRHIEDWYQYPAAMDVRDFYGGDLQGVLDKMDYLQDLGVEVLYFNPIFVSPSNHKYDTQDYDHVDPHYGKIVRDGGRLLEDWENENTRAERYIRRVTDLENLEASDRMLMEVIQEAHRRGMRVILDGVFNHCGSFNKWLDREKIYQKSGRYAPGAYVSADSPYRDFFSFKNPDGWPDNTSYEGWWGHDTLPKLNYEGSDILYQYILDVAKKWLSPPYSVDGWRLDVAADLGHSPEMNHRFWRDFRKVVKETNPDALILAEHYGDASSWLEGDQWDTVMNYDAFMEPVSWFLTGLEKHSDRSEPHLFRNSQAFMSTMLYKMSRMQTPSLMAAMNELSNHDHSRFLTRTNQKIGRLHTAGAAAASEGINYGIFRSAVVIQMTWPGAPTIYYGDEAGLCGWTDPDNRRTFPWGRENHELTEFHRYLIDIRRGNSAFRTGAFKWLTAENGVIAYGRFDEQARGVVVVNSESYSQKLRIPVWEAEVTGNAMERVMETNEERYNAGMLSYPVYDGMLEVEIGPNSSMIFEEKQLDF